MQQFATYRTDWDELPERTRDRLIVTGKAAVDYLLEGVDPAEQSSIVAYTDLEPVPAESPEAGLARAGLEVPPAEDGKDLYVIMEEPPASMADGQLRVATEQVALGDYQTANPRVYTDRLDDPAFQELLAAGEAQERAYED